MRLSGRIGAAATLAVILARASTAGAGAITLPEAIERALKLAPSVDIAAAASDMSRAQVREQRAPLYPSIGAGGEYYQAPGYDEVVTNRGLSAGLVTLNYTAWDWGRRQANVRASEYVAQAARLGVTAARAQIVFDTTVAYYDLIRARESERDLDASLKRLARYVATVEALQRSGRVIANDVLKFRSARDNVELALAAAHGNTQRASAALGILIGEPASLDVAIEPIAGIPPKPTGDLALSPVMQAAQHAISSAGMQIKAAQAERLPTFQVAFTTGFLGVDPRPTLSHNFGGSYDTVVSMPLFEGGLISSHIDQAKARQIGAVAQARQAEYLLRRRIADAAARFDQAREQLRILSGAQPTADDAFALVWSRFLGGGNVTMLEVLDAYQQSEQLRMQRHEHEFVARESVAESNLLYGRIK